jgi:hypothetical protein
MGEIKGSESAVERRFSMDPRLRSREALDNSPAAHVAPGTPPRRVCDGTLNAFDAVPRISDGWDEGKVSSVRGALKLERGWRESDPPEPRASGGSRVHPKLTSWA